MADKNTVWTAVVARYPGDPLITLTNPFDRSATSINTAFGTEAANGCLNLWPAYAQVDFDVTDGLHLETAVRGTIALLFERGGSSQEIAKIDWKEVFGDEGLMAQVRKTNPRAHRGPSSNSGVTQKTEQTASGGNYRGWADRESLPIGTMPKRTTAD